MSHTLYATFDNPEDAERAAGALLDRGARTEDLSVVRRPGDGFSAVTEPKTVASDVTIDPNDLATAKSPEPTTDRAESETTTTGDVATAAIQGTVIGAGLGAVVAIASLIVPGVGFVLGAGALASAIGGVAATAGTGAAAGAIVGYLKEMGVNDEAASEYGDTVADGGAVIAVNVPSGGLDEAATEALLKEYDATKIDRYATRAIVG